MDHAFPLCGEIKPQCWASRKPVELCMKPEASSAIVIVIGFGVQLKVLNDWRSLLTRSISIITYSDRRLSCELIGDPVPAAGILQRFGQSEANHLLCLVPSTKLPLSKEFASGYVSS